jgi:hypothetical protein
MGPEFQDLVAGISVDSGDFPVNQVSWPRDRFALDCPHRHLVFPLSLLHEGSRY